ncbi:MAG: phenylalanine--tRNA ligase subunit alpha, partial [Humidesulfovibrio sp.]|nr:phenylalanine--tRNA ligase subunit alpha [Humidesulfovibrio sp.]
MNETLKSFLEGLDGLTLECAARRGQVFSLPELEALRVELLGRKGRLAEAMTLLARMGPEDKPAAGRKANEVKAALTALLESRQEELTAESAQDALAGFDPSLPGRRPAPGSLHPVTLAMQEICEVLTGLGFEVVAGPEVENDWFNFEALNMPPDHPARDMQ